MRLSAAAAVVVSAVLASGVQASDACEGGKIAVRLSVGAAVVVVGEPVVVTTAVENAGSGELEVPANLDLIYGLVELWVRDPQGSMSQFKPTLNAMLSHLDMVRLAPSELISHRELLFLDAGAPHGRFPFRQSGRYGVWATFRGITSEPVSVVVAEPTGEDAEALPLFMGPEQGKVIAGISKSPAAVESLATITTSYSGTVYAPYAAFALGHLAVSEKQYDEAAERLQWVLDHAPGFPLKQEAVLLLARVDKGQGNVGSAKERLASVVELDPNTTTARQARRLLEEWQ